MTDARDRLRSAAYDRSPEMYRDRAVRSVSSWSIRFFTTSPMLTMPHSRLSRTTGRCAAPVVDETGAVVGLVSEYDLLAKTGQTAGEVMTTGLISVTPDTNIADVRHLLVDRRIRRVPVLLGGRLVGIISRRDVVALMATEWVCVVCGEPVRGERPPQVCPKCSADRGQFVLQEQPPGV